MEKLSDDLLYTMTGSLFPEDVNNLATDLIDTRQKLKQAEKELKHYRGFVPSHPFMAYPGTTIEYVPQVGE